MLLNSENVLWKVCTVLAGFVISLVGATMEGSHNGESRSLPRPSDQDFYNPFYNYAMNLTHVHATAVVLNLKQDVLKSSLIQDLLPPGLEKDKQFDWELTTTIGAEVVIADHFQTFPSHKPIFDHALGLWSKRNKKIIGVLAGEHERIVIGESITESVSVGNDILQATLEELKEQQLCLSLADFHSLRDIIDFKISLEYLYTVLPVYRKIMLVKIGNYIGSRPQQY